jgi:Cys-rich protein (TIGR01571 family)
MNQPSEGYCLRSSLTMWSLWGAFALCYILAGVAAAPGWLFSLLWRLFLITSIAVGTKTIAELRARIRVRDRIPGHPHEDCCVAACCPQCAVIQLARQDGWETAPYQLCSPTGVPSTARASARV